jgi:hypothetical protein
VLVAVVVTLRRFSHAAAMIGQKTRHVLELKRGVMNAEGAQNVI